MIRKNRREILFFGMTGGIGFLIDAGVLTWLVQVQGWGLYSARALSFAAAVTVTWYLNRSFTFAKRASTGRTREYGRYFGVQAMGALINLGVYVLVIALLPATGTIPVIPLAMGSGVGMIFNFVGARHFAFTPPKG
ncbi:MAG: GtrA family protein [Chromatiaceae bacterium]|nr:GtrA family protein [Chromatiaceae bacterium]